MGALTRSPAAGRRGRRGRRAAFLPASLRAASPGVILAGLVLICLF